MREIAAARDGDKNALRWNLARFYFAHDFHRETMGVLEVVVAEDESVKSDPEWLMLHGATQFLLRRFEGAADDLGNRYLETEPHAALGEARCCPKLVNGRTQNGNTHQVHRS